MFPVLREWETTRNALHAYTKVLGAIRASFSEPHPKWWHVSLRPYTSGLSTTNIPHPSKEGQTFSISLELRNHYVLFSNSEGFVEQIRISDGPSPNQLFDGLCKMMVEDGIECQADNSKFENAEQQDYSIDKAEKYFLALSRSVNVMHEIKAGVRLETSPVQLWPHHFDLSFEIFGDKDVAYEEDGQSKSAKSQIGIGFAAFDAAHPDPYFYVNPFPFDDKITQEPLAPGAHWHLEGWKGACLPYAKLVEAEDGEQLLKDYLLGAIAIEKSLI